jgi:putative addiction module antidote
LTLCVKYTESYKPGPVAFRGPIGCGAHSSHILDMVRTIKLRQAGRSVVVTLPKDIAERLNLAVGDSVLAVETSDGILLTPYDPAIETGLGIATRAAKRYRHALRELAK